MTRCPVGTIIRYEQLEEGVAFCRSCGMDTLQLRLGDAAAISEAQLRELRAILQPFPAATALAGYPGKLVWDFREGPGTIGLGDASGRELRMFSLLRAAEVCAELQIPLATAHLGFVPENPCDSEYDVYVECLRRLGRRYGELGVGFCLETGQETPVALLRLMADAGEAAVAVNLDPANLVMYGKANATDGAELLGPRVRSMHVKDGRYPACVDFDLLGEETFPGEGRVDFPSVFAALKQAGFHGPVIIEREIPDRFPEVQRIVPLVRAWLQQAQLDGGEG